MRKDLRRDFQGRDYPVRLLRYWWAGQALAAESRRKGRKLRVLDLGCERGWLRLFTPADCVEEWTGVDWDPRSRQQLGYDEVIAANFDEALPLRAGRFDAVVSLHVFEHLPRPGATVAEVSRVLADDGIFLAATPTMPEPFARWREAYYRKKFANGRLAPGGHINSMSPRRWRKLLYEVGLNLDFLTGSHAVRWSGSALENSKWWIRANQLWAALFPSLGSECCLQARRRPATHVNAAPLYRRTRLPRVALASGALGLLAILVFAGARAWNEATLNHAEVDKVIAEWIERKQDGNDQFYVWHEWAGQELRTRPDVTVLNDPGDFQGHYANRENIHVLLSQETSRHFLAHDISNTMTISSHIEVGERDFYVLNLGLSRGTKLQDFL